MRISDWSSDVCSSDLCPTASRPEVIYPQRRGLSPNADEGSTAFLWLFRFPGSSRRSSTKPPRGDECRCLVLTAGSGQPEGAPFLGEAKAGSWTDGWPVAGTDQIRRGSGGEKGGKDVKRAGG